MAEDPVEIGIPVPTAQRLDSILAEADKGLRRRNYLLGAGFDSGKPCPTSHPQVVSWRRLGRSTVLDRAANSPHSLMRPKGGARSKAAPRLHERRQGLEPIAAPQQGSIKSLNLRRRARD